jgi:CheY-like chemotaxis protein
MRKDLGEVLNRAHYKNEVVEVAKREKPFALVLSATELPVIMGVREIASEQKMDTAKLIELLRAVPEERLRAVLCEAED